MNATTIHSSEVVGQLVLIETDPIRQRVKHAIAGFLAGYSSATLEAYRLDLRGWITWLDATFLDPFAVERAHIELYARWCESEGKARSTIGRRLSTICGFYKYCSQERLIEREGFVRAAGRGSPPSGPVRHLLCLLSVELVACASRLGARPSSSSNTSRVATLPLSRSPPARTNNSAVSMRLDSMISTGSWCATHSFMSTRSCKVSCPSISSFSLCSGSSVR